MPPPGCLGRDEMPLGHVPWKALQEQLKPMVEVRQEVPV